MNSLQRRPVAARVALALLLPLAAFAVQWTFWNTFRPFIWFLFYPAVFFSPLVGGFAGGLAATLLSTVLVWRYFILPTTSLRLDEPGYLVSTVAFVGMGALFAFFHEHLRRATRAADEAQERARQAEASRAGEETIAGRLRESAAALAAANARLAATNAELADSRAAALNLMEDAGIARDAALRSESAKSAFLANMSHEIRTPLHHIIGLGHLVRRDLPEAAQRQRMDQLCAAADHLLELVNDILDLSRIEAERMTLADGDFRLADVTDKGLRMVAEAAREKGLTLTADIAPAVRELRLRGDALRLAQVLINLCGNAVKFTAAGGVHLAVERLDDTADSPVLRFAVEDSGSGIAAADLERLFRPFVQVEAAPRHGGTGLGLAISQRIVALMGGVIRVESRPGSGSRFWFDLALPLAASEAVRASAADGAAETGGRWVLLAEDHPLSQEILFEMLEDLGCEADVASDGAEAVACAEANAYDLILMDMQMPVMDGLEATRRIRALPGHWQTPIVALTANIFDEDRERCLAAGMNAHLGKPVSPAQLAGALHRWLSGVAAPEAGDDPAADCDVSPPLAALPGLEVPAAMRRSAETQAEYHALLTRFVAIHGQDMALLRRQLAAGERDAAQTLAHNLKGIAGLLGATQIAVMATEIMQELRAGAGAETLEPLRTACEGELTRFAAAVAALP